MSTAPLLVLAVGNPSRGDDGLGPALVERLREAGALAPEAVELVVEFQLQIEHALDLADRRAVLFVDAARPGAARGVALAPIDADPGPPTASHALRPQALLGVGVRLGLAMPPAWQLAIEGEAFGLGEALSAAAQRRLDEAVRLAARWIGERLGDA